MKNKSVLFFFLFCTIFLAASYTTYPTPLQKNPVVVRDTIKVNPAMQDSLNAERNETLVLHKKGAHASYYHNKFNGRRTASGTRFDNEKYTAAHRKLPFGTKVKVTNEVNGKSVVVTITDRGPFVKGREIDLSRRSFMDIASNKNSGSLKVTLEIIK